MRKVLNANRFIYLFIYLFVIGCYSNKEVILKKNYSINKFKSFDNWITINAIDKEAPYMETNPIIMINNVYFSNKDSSFNVGIGKHNIEISALSKSSVYIKNLVVKQGDSIVINTYLKDDPSPLH